VTEPTAPSEVDARLVQVLDGYLANLQAGAPPDREELLARHPDLAADLDACLGSLEFIRQAGVRGTGAPLPDGADDPPGVLGDYRIIREVGRGGMGVVYEAVQESLGRRVALKVLPFASALDARQLQRFKNEAQAAAQLHHAHIVPVYAVGKERGVHFFAMQFVDGQSLSSVIAELRRLEHGRPAEGDTTPLPGALSSCRSSKALHYVRAVARLGVQACDALEHAHQVGVIHRDVKPANLLVDAQGHLWVTDFGLARCPHERGLTLTGDLVGTLRYMSPEQAGASRAPVGHHTDVYALGASLYELLTLEPAFPGSDRVRLLEQIAGEDPRPLRKLNRAVTPELETIVLKALEKAPEDRYASARELGDDLARFLEDRPILARRPNLLARAVKWSRRHRLALASAAIVLLLAVVGLAVSTVLISRQRDEAEQRRAEADEQRVEAEHQRARADEQRREARQAVDDMYTGVAEAVLAHQPRLQPLQRLFLLKALAYYERLAHDGTDDPSARRDLGLAVLRVANIRQQLGELDRAGPAYERAVGVLDRLAADHPAERTYREDLATAHECRGVFLLKMGKPREAERDFRRAIALNRRLLAEVPTEPLYQGKLATNQHNLGALLLQRGQFVEAEADLRQARRTLERLSTHQDPNYARFFGLTCRNLGVLLHRTGRSAKALDALGQAIAVHKGLTEKYPELTTYRHELASIYDARAQVRHDDGAAVVKDLTRVLEIRKRLAADFPDVLDFRHDLAQGHGNLGNVLLAGGRVREAEDQLKASASVLEQLVKEYPALPVYRLDLARCHMLLGTVLGVTGRLAEAEQPLRAALTSTRALVAGAPKDMGYQEELARAHLNFGIFLTVTGKPLEARATLGESRRLYLKLIAEHPNLPRLRKELTKVENQLGQLPPAGDQTR
jgi:serine/threonine protein kinase/Tfp pilus assembly protein PilF